MPERCSSFSAQPPAPTKTNFARISPGVRPTVRRYFTRQVPSGRRLRRRTSVFVRTSAPFSARRSMSWWVSAPKSTSVPAGIRVAANGSPLRRFCISSGAHCVDDARVLAVLDAGEQRLVLQRLVALLEVGDILLAPHEGHVRGGVDERRRSVEHAGLDERRPQLAALLELLVDRDRLGGVDRAVLALGHVVQLAERRVAGAGVVPGVRALQRDVAQSLEDGDLQVGLQLLQQRAERRTHDAAADQQNVDRPRGEIAVVRAGQGVGGRFGHQTILVPPESTPDRAPAPPRKVPRFLPQRQSERMPRPAASARSRVVELRRSRRGWLRRAPRSARR